MSIADVKSITRRGGGINRRGASARVFIIRLKWKRPEHGAQRSGWSLERTMGRYNVRRTGFSGVRNEVLHLTWEG